MDKSIITFSANEQNLQKTGGIGCYASDTVSYIEAQFALGDNWSGYDSIRAVWFNDYKTISTVLDPDGVCIVPHEVLVNRGKVMVNLVGSVLVSEELTDRLTTFPCEALKVSAKAKISGSETAAVTPSQFEQFVASVRNDANRAEAGATASEASASEASASAEQATLSAQASEASALRASGHAQNAQSAETSARAYAQSAQNYATDAENAKDDAIDARDEIRSMRANAETLEPNQSATALYSNGVLTLGIPKGQKGDTGDTGTSAGFGTVSASVDDSTGTPSVEVTASGADTAKNFAFAFHNLKGAKGDKGDDGTVPDLDLILPTDTASGDIASITDGQNIVPVKSLKVTLEPIQSGSGDPSPDNVRPISGHTDVVTEVCGFNVWDEEWESGQYNPSTGAKTNRANAIRCKNLIPVKPNTSYYFGCASHPSTGDGVWLWYKQDGTYINYVTGNLNRVQTSPSDAYFMAFYIAPETTYHNDISVNYPSTATSYEPYNGTTYTTPLGRTVYGGTLDVVSGELVVDRAMVDLSTLAWLTTSTQTADGSQCHYADVSGMATDTANTGMISDRFTLASGKYISTMVEGTMIRGGGKIYVATNADTISGQLCYPLATPQTYQLTPQQVMLLHGNNNVWSDGEVEMVYNADVGLYIDKKLGTSGTRTLSMTRALAKSEDTDDTKSEETKTDDTETELKSVQLAED